MCRPRFVASPARNQPPTDFDGHLRVAVLRSARRRERDVTHAPPPLGYAFVLPVPMPPSRPNARPPAWCRRRGPASTDDLPERCRASAARRVSDRSNRAGVQIIAESHSAAGNRQNQVTRAQASTRCRPVRRHAFDMLDTPMVVALDPAKLHPKPGQWFLRFRRGLPAGGTAVISTTGTRKAAAHRSSMVMVRLCPRARAPIPRNSPRRA